MAKPKKSRLISANLILWAMTALYTISPIDLIPDFIPILGWADDGAGWLATLTFTAYTLWQIRSGGGLGALRKEGLPKTLTPEAKPASGIQGYEPMSYEELKAL